MSTAAGINVYLVVAILVFASVVLFLRGLYLLWNAARGPAARRLEQRLQSLSATFVRERETSSATKAAPGETAMLDALLRHVPAARRLQDFIDQSGLAWSAGRLLTACTAAACAGLAMTTIILHLAPLTGLVAGAVCGMLPAGYVARRRKRRLATLERQLPEALDLINRALRAGHAFSSGLQMVGEEMADPIAGEFRTACEEINFGVSLQQALLNLHARVPLTDLRYFVVAVLIQRESGGNLTEILGNLARLIRDRLKFLSRIRILSAEGRLSAWILVIMPFALAALLNLFSPDFMSPLWKDPIGISIIQVTLGLMAAGIVILRRIVRIRV